MAIKRPRDHRARGRASQPRLAAWLEPLPVGPVRFDPTLRTAKQLVDEAGTTSVGARPCRTAGDATGAPRRAA